MEILRPLAVQETLIKKGLHVFTAQDFILMFHVPRQKIKYFLETYTKLGLFLRLKQGIYALKNPMPPEEVIANILYRPSYISFEYAMARHHILPEMVYQITSATTKPTREFSVQQKIFSYRKIQKKAFTGYEPIIVQGYTVFMAEPEKALIDYLYFVSLGRKAFHERLRVSHLHKKKLRYYASLYNRSGLFELLSKLLP